MKLAHQARRFPSSRGRRRAVATLWLLVVLALLTAVLGTTTWQHLTARRVLDQRHKQLQAAWLARAGVELAAARLLSNPADYTGESVALLPGAQVRLTVQSELASTPHPAFAASSVGLVSSPLGQGSLLAASVLLLGRTGSAQMFAVTSEARYRTDEPPVVVRSLTRHFRRVIENERVLLERTGPVPQNR
ncbi:MAG: hypothetical protein L0Z62_04920 [Gemmataceae bacterium]|nr:hypothetical protein [Gemmataceae bacterium]